MSSLSVRSARAAHGSPRDDFAATVARELAAQRPASARPAPRAGERDVERLSMAPVEQYDWEEVANELQAENNRLETALAQTRMRADKKLKQLNVLRDELAERAQGLLGLNEQPTGRRTALTSRMSFNARRTFAANAAGVSETEAGAAMLMAATAPRSRSASKT